MAWIQLPSVSVSNGSKLVTVSGGYDLANVEAGWSLDVGPTRAEIQSVSAQDANGVSTITLARNWDGSNVNAQPAQIVPIAGGELYVIKQLQDANDYAVQTHAALRDYGTQDAVVTLTPPGGEPVSFASLPKQDRLASEQRNSNQQSFNSQLQQQQSDVNDLLSNKATDGHDTTPGALLAVGATIKQLDTTNSNIQFEPSVPWTLVNDFERNEYKKYTQEGGLRLCEFSDSVSLNRSSGRSMTGPTGKISALSAGEPAFNFNAGINQGLSLNPTTVNYAWPSEDLTTSKTNDTRVNRTVQTFSGKSDVISQETVIVPDDDLGAHYVEKRNEDMNITLTNGKFINTQLLIRDSDFRYIQIAHYLASGGAGGCRVIVDTLNKVIDSVGGADYVTSEIERSSDGIIVRLRTVVSDESLNFLSRVAVLNDQKESVFSSNLTDSVTLTAWSVDNGSYFFPYIPTLVSSMSTTSDNAETNLSGDVFDSSGDWTVAGSFLPVQNSANSNERYLSINDSTPANRVDFTNGNGNHALIVAQAGVAVTLTTDVAIDAGVVSFVLRKSKNLLSYFIKGGTKSEIQLQNSQWSVDTVYYGRGQSTTHRAATVFGSLKVCPAALADSECEGLLL